MTSQPATIDQAPESVRPDWPCGALQLLLESLPVPAWCRDDANARVLAVNRHALLHYGYASQEFLELRMTELEALPFGRDPAAWSKLRHHRKADGTVIAVRLETNPIAVDGRPATLILATDVTEERRALDESDRRSGVLPAAERRLRESDELFRRLFETASDWYWTLDAKRRVSFVSPNFESIYGLPIKEMLGKRLGDDLDNAKLDFEANSEAMAALRARRPFRDMLYSYLLSNGRTVYARCSAVPIVGKDGEFGGYFGMSKDVTAEIEAARALRESERQARQVLEAAADLYWEEDEDFRFTYVSEAGETVFGFPTSQWLGKRFAEVANFSMEPETARMVTLALRAKQPYRDFVFWHTLPDGGKRWYKVSAAPFFDGSGAFKGYRGVTAEITKQVQAEAAAEIAGQHLQEAVGHVTQPIAVFDGGNRMIGFNQAFMDLHLRVAPQVNSPVYVGAAFRKLCEWQLSFGLYADGPDAPPVILDTLLGRYENDEEHTYRLYDGRWMQVVHHRLPGGGVIALWTDVTALKRAEAERLSLEAQLHHSQRLEALGTLAGGIAHEINNALVPVIALTKQVAGKLPEGSRERRSLDMAAQGGERSRDLVKQILAFSRNRKEAQRQERFDLAATVRDALMMMRASLPTTIRLEDKIDPVAPLLGDPDRIHQVVVNLVTNAAQAIGAAMGRIAVALWQEGDELRLSVSDTGCGMDEATKARIFEPFFTTKDVGRGTGLGLSMVDGTIRNHGGRIAVESTPGAGARFDIVLPAAMDADA